MSADCVIGGESDFYLCVFEKFRDESGSFAYIREISPTLFLGLCAVVMFFLLWFYCQFKPLIYEQRDYFGNII